MSLKTASFAASLVVLCAMAPAQVAHASVSAAGGASALCKAASGPGASVFYFDTAGGALNTSGITQYLTCHIPDIDKASGEQLQNLFMHFVNNTASQKQITCVVQFVHVGTTTTSAIYTETLAANTPHYFNSYTTASSPALPARDADGTYIMSCAIPAGAALGSLRATYNGTIGA